MWLSLLLGVAARSSRDSEEAIRHEIRSSPSSEFWDAENCANSRFGESGPDFEILDADGWVVRIRRGARWRRRLLDCRALRAESLHYGCVVDEEAPREQAVGVRHRRPHGHGGFAAAVPSDQILIGE